MVSIQIWKPLVQKRRKSGKRRPGAGGLRDSFAPGKGVTLCLPLRSNDGFESADANLLTRGAEIEFSSSNSVSGPGEPF